MPITADFHMHSSHSGDGNTPVEQMIQEAVRSGMTQICFTEHQDFDYPESPEIPPDFFLLNTDAYLRDLIGCQTKYAGSIRVGFGVELGLQPHLAQIHTRYIRSFDFDFVIASSHVCHGQDPFYPAFYQGRSEEEAYRDYFSSILENLRLFQDFDVYGHLDYVVRYGPDKDTHYTYQTYQDIFDQILMLLLEKGKGLELNTGGLKHGLREPNPCSAVLKRYRSLGGEIITVGSDAHVPESIGSSFARAEDILKKCGFSYYTTFHHRVPEYHKLT